MPSGINTVIFPVKDVAAAKTLYATLLGTKPMMDEPYYVGFQIGDNHVGLDPNGHAQGMTGPVCFVHVDDLEAAVADLVAAGASIDLEPRDVGGGTRIARVTDGSGNPIGLRQSAG